MTLFVALARYKVKDTYATAQMLDYAMSSMAAKGFQLQELKNLMISADGRPRNDICKFYLIEDVYSYLIGYYRSKDAPSFCIRCLGPHRDQCLILPRPQSYDRHTILHVHRAH